MRRDAGRRAAGARRARSTSSTGGSTSRSGRSTQAAITASYVPWRAQRAVDQLGGESGVPPVELPALAAASRSAARSSPGSTRLAYASRSSTARSASKASTRTGSRCGRRYGVPCGRRCWSFAFNVLRILVLDSPPACVLRPGPGPASSADGDAARTRGSTARTAPAGRWVPRAQSAAGIRFLPCGWTSPSSTAWLPVPTCTAFLPTASSPGARSVRSGHQRDRAQLEPLAAEEGPGAGGRGAAADQPVDPQRGGRPVDARRPRR